MKKLFSILLVAVMLVSICVFSANATTAPAGALGDLNGDWKVDIFDVTEIQLGIAGRYEFDAEKQMYADVNQDGKVNIFDATYIQMWLADLIEDNRIGVYYNHDMYTNDFYADYESGMAMAGVPVTFTINARAGSPMQRYELYVDGECVSTSATDNSLTHTFSQAGEYDVEMRAVAFYATGTMGFRGKYVVAEPYESETPMFKTLYLTGKIQWGTITYGVDDMAVHADAIGGEGPYQYKFVFERPAGFRYDTEIITQIQDYSQDNVFELEEIKLSEIDDGSPGLTPDLECMLTVYIKDANNNVVSREMPIVYTGDVPIG